MSRYHRGRAEATEQVVVNELNSDPTPPEVQEAADMEMGELLAQSIEEDFNRIHEARHVGNSYASVGDIVVNTGDREVFAEVKSVESGTGTLSNLGGNVLTEFGLFEGAISWTKFRDRRNHSQWVNNELDRFDYPGNRGDREEKAGHIKNVLDITRNTYPKAREILEGNPTDDEQLAAEIVRNIHERDTKERLSYLDHLESCPQNQDNIRKFILLIIAGQHTHSQIKQHWSIQVDELESVLANYRVYYANKQDHTVRTKDPTGYFTELATYDYSIAFNEGNTSVKVIADDGNSERLVMRGQLYWGNKFQGIATPRLNTFEEEVLTELNDHVGL
ncbi:hypothetical protein [Halorubrum sp. 48-1-W]|uniref:hypothetical protein n=1 Tax=Halorubrum sp. 48-1-W TaxID=2249761 RepID=UPI000FCC54FF|nr:hypothetical protein [Halorubrum sp. 48-1-W]